MPYTTLVSPHELAQHLDDPNWIIFDCRFSLADSHAGGTAYRHGHLPGARYVHLNDDLSSPIQSYTGHHPLPNFSALAQKLGQWGVNHRKQVVVYDDAGGAFAGRLWWLLRVMGHTQVAVLDGGIGHWQKQGLPLTTTLPVLAATSFRAYLDPQQWLSAQQVENALATQSITLLDARTAERYHGLQEPIDPVAGHVPKAKNHPFQRNLDNNGLFRSAEQLNNQFSALLDRTPPEPVVHMCGSGVTACHNLLAMEIAGLSDSKLYAGSWSEWITNRNRGVATI